jgi:hypothetical protein
MKSPILFFAVILTLALAALDAVYADSATWNLNPVTGDWNTADNWTPATVPNGPTDVATFSRSSRSTLSVFNTLIGVASVIFDPAATNYTIFVEGEKALGELTIGDGAL